MEERGEAGGGGERWEGEGRGEKRERERGGRETGLLASQMCFLFGTLWDF